MYSLESFSLRWHTLPLRDPYHWAPGVVISREVGIVRFAVPGLDVHGFGEIAFPPGQIVNQSSVLAEMKNLVSEWSPTGEPLHEMSSALTNPNETLHRLSEVGRRVRCGLVSAWCDAHARAQGKSLALLLSTLTATDVSEHIPVNALVAEADVKRCVETVSHAMAQGVGTVKIKLLGEEVSDYQRVHAIRESFPHIRIRLDPNGCWIRSETLRFLERYRALDIDYVEDPLPGGSSVEEYATLRAQSPIPIALDAACSDLETATEILSRGAADVLVLKPQRVGGPDVVLHIAARAKRASVAVTLTGSLESAIGTRVGFHTAACLPSPISACGLLTSRFFAKDFGKIPDAQGGCVSLSQLPDDFEDQPTSVW